VAPAARDRGRRGRVRQLDARGDPDGRDTKESAGLSLFATGDFKSNPEGLNRNVEIPNLLSWISTGYPRGEARAGRGVLVIAHEPHGLEAFDSSRTACASRRRARPRAAARHFRFAWCFEHRMGA
jgi:hypothetical protein